MSNSQAAKLSELATEITVGYVGPMVNEYKASGVPFLRSLNVEPGRINTNELKFIDGTFHAKLRKSALRPGDVVIVRTGKPGVASVIPDTLAEANCSDLVIVRPGPKLDPRFLAYYVNSVAQEHVDAHVVGAVQQHFNIGSAKEIEIPRWPLEAQRAVARILGALDDKIELHRRMNRTLETLAQKLFRSWFVDFDPVVAKSEGRKPFGLSNELAALFPSEFEDSELGPVPRGWRPVPLGDAIRLVRDLVDPQEAGLEEFDHFSIPAFDSGQRPVREMGSAIKSGKYLVPDDAILLSKLNPETPRVWWPTPDAQRRAIASTEFLVCRAKPEVNRVWLYWQLRDADFLDEFATRVTGTSNSHQRVRPDDLLRLERVDAGQALRDRFAGLVEASTKRMVANLAQSQKLAALRDLLLPRLLSGELRVPVAERAITAAL